MNRYPSCTDAVTESLAPAETTATTSELRSGVVRTLRLAVAYLLPITFNAGVGTGSGLGAATGLTLGFAVNLIVVRAGDGLAVGLGLLVRRSFGSCAGVAVVVSTAGWSTAGAG